MQQRGEPLWRRVEIDSPALEPSTERADAVRADDISAPTEGPFSLDALEQRHLDRRTVQAIAVEAEARVRDVLCPPEPPPLPWWQRLRQRWSAQPETLDPREAADRYERTLRAVRALGFQLLSLEQACQDATLDALACQELQKQLHQQLISSDTAAAVRARLTVTLGRAEALGPLVEAEADLLSEHHANLVELHHAANDVVAALGRQALVAAAGSGRKRDSAAVDAVVRRAAEAAAELHHRVDTRETRLRELDAEARERLAARAEVEGWLDRRC